ncbi:MFS transporter [Candidatus Magnetaquicoccus inordinatus]|uniref:MFS transporter n=1 Tax=Candidatus Magnetaquicoccus inordinatus TaxID=2496818 RepID=UPI00102C8D82|nr:MFS transporter [Candidatus Magnetaquicoccus inordinatus]
MSEAISPHAVFRHRAFTTYWLSRITGNIATFLQGVAIGWVVYSTARLTLDEAESMFLVGMLGLVQFLPMFALALVAGAVADRYDRRSIFLSCILLQLFCSLAFTWLAAEATPSLPLIFIVSAFFGISRTFAMPAAMAMSPTLVPAEVLPGAIAWNTLGVQGGMILGPWLGGLLTADSPVVANASAALLYLFSLLAALWLYYLPVNTRPPASNNGSRLTMIREGLFYIWGSKAVFGAISLDLFAVLLGGVTALLPAFAKDVLDIGPEGFGQLRSVFALGAGSMTLLLAFYPLRRRLGYWMLGGVALFGLATLVFALSRSVLLSMMALMVAGAADSISVFVRQNLVQILTPNAMRGRVSAVSGLFISASNELGEFESGVAARFLGVVGSAIFGGLGAIAVTLLWAKLFPALREADRLQPPAPH